jgi:hypothetical protein
MGCAPSTAVGVNPDNHLSFEGQAVPEDFYKQVGVQGVVLRRCNLTAVPTGTFSMRHLQSLDISENDISEIPALIANLAGLTVRCQHPRAQRTREQPVLTQHAAQAS